MQKAVPINRILVPETEYFTRIMFLLTIIARERFIVEIQRENLACFYTIIAGISRDALKLRAWIKPLAVCRYPCVLRVSLCEWAQRITWAQ